MTRKCFWWGFLIVIGIAPLTLAGQSTPVKQAVSPTSITNAKMETTADWNRRLEELVNSAVSGARNAPSQGDYRIGPNDELAINVLEAPDLCVAVRVSADGNITLPLLGTIRAEGLTARELGLVLQALLRRTYMKDPQVTVTVIEMQSHSVSVLGAVKNPGVFQIRGTKTVLEMLSLAGGLAPEAGNEVLVMRGASAEFVRDNVPQIHDARTADVPAPQAGPEGTSTADKTKNKDTIVISLKRLLDTGDPKYNVPIHAGDIIKVKAAGIVYVVGDVQRPGGFPVKDNEHITVLQAIALGEGLGPDAAKSKAKVIRVAQNGEQIEYPVHLGKMLSGKAPDLPLRPSDILFIPRNGAKTASRAVLKTFGQMIIWRGIP